VAIRDDTQARVDRLKGGKFLNHDVSAIFVNLRDYFHSRESFRDIGNFLAHKEKRDQGAVFNVTRDMALYMRFSIPFIANSGGPISATHLQLTAALKANVNLLTDENLHEALGMRRADVRSHLGSALKCLNGVNNGKIVQVKNLTVKQLTVVNYLMSVLKIRPAFDAEILFDDFCYVLIREKYITTIDVSKLAYAKSLLALYCAAQMHGSEIDLGDGQSTPLVGGTGDGKIQVTAKVPNVHGAVGISVPVFTSELSAKKFCNKQLRPPKSGDVQWQRPVELNRRGKLSIIK
jgi:hypothetical protein